MIALTAEPLYLDHVEPAVPLDFDVLQPAEPIRNQTLND